MNFKMKFKIEMEAHCYDPGCVFRFWIHIHGVKNVLYM